MGNITKVGLGFDADSLMRCVLVKGDDLKAGEALAKQDACYVASDGTVMKTVTTQTTISGVADFDGMAYAAFATGEPVTLVGRGAVLDYGASMTPGAFLYASATAGAIGTIVLANDEPIAKVLEDNRILVIR